MTKHEAATIAALLAKHYCLQGSVSATEAKDEVRMLARRMSNGLLDDRQGYLAASIQVATGRDVIELHKG